MMKTCRYCGVEFEPPNVMVSFQEYLWPGTVNWDNPNWICTNCVRTSVESGLALTERLYDSIFLRSLRRAVLRVLFSIRINIGDRPDSTDAQASGGVANE